MSKKITENSYQIQERILKTKEQSLNILQNQRQSKNTSLKIRESSLKIKEKPLNIIKNQSNSQKTY